MTDKQIIIEDCPHFIGGCCQEYLDGVCENHKCDLKIIRELEQKLKAKEQECEVLKEEIKTKTYHWEECTEEILKGTKHFVDRMEKAEKTLTEIKEIAEKCCIMQAILDCENYDDCTQCGRTSDGEGIQQILQKISEVTND